MAVDPRNDSVIYAAAPSGGLFKSIDAAGTWSSLFDTQPSLQVCSIAIDPRTPDVVYAGTGDGQSPTPAQGVLRSADAGRTWAAGPRFTDRPVCALAIDPANTTRILAGSEEGLFLSTDSGTTWANVLATPVTSIAFDVLGVVYAGTLGDVAAGDRQRIVARSSDSGRTWAFVPLPPNLNAATAAVTSVSVLTGGSLVFAAVSTFGQVDFYATNDGGHLWTPTFALGAPSSPVALFFGLNGNLILGATDLFTSADNGTTWSIIPTKTAGFHSAVFTGGMLVLGGDGGLEPVAPGTTPRPVGPLPAPQMLGVAITATGFFAGGPSGLFGSSIAAGTGVAGVQRVGKVAAAVEPDASTDIFAVSANQVHSSSDAGATFTSSAVIAPGELRAPYPPIALDPVLPTSAFIAGRRVYHTTNTGTTWTALGIVDPNPSRVVIALALAPAARSTLFAATACLPEVTPADSCPAISVVWRSTNAGQSWTQMSIVPGLINRFAVDSRQSTRVYAAIGAFPAGPSHDAGLVDGDLLLSTNAGAAWSSLRGGMPHTSINTVLIDASTLPGQFLLPAQTIYVGTNAGVFVSFDAGTRWTDITNGLPRSPVTDLALLQPDGILLAATFGRGVYAASVTGLAAGLIVQPLSQQVSISQGSAEDIGLALSNASTSAATGWQLASLDSWLTVQPSSGTVRPQGFAPLVVTVSTAGLSTGTYVGRLQLTTTSGIQNITIETTVTPTPSQMTIYAGDAGSALPGATLPPLQVLVVDNAQQPLPGVPVQFTITSGAGSLSARIVNTNASGIASASLTLPAIAGPVQVTATTGPLIVTFTETAIAAPSLMTDAVINAVTFNAITSFGPGSIIAIIGKNLSTGEAIAPATLPVSLANSRVLLATPVGDVAMPLFFVSPQQIRALVPFDVAPGRYLLHTESGSLRSNDVEISIDLFNPGIYTLGGNGTGPGIFYKDDGTLVTGSNPADRGSRITFFAAGLGAVNPRIESGQPGASSEPLNRTTQVPQVFFDRFAANVVYSGLAPGVAGRYQVTVQVPAFVSPATNISVSLTIGGFASNRVTVPVR